MNKDSRAKAFDLIVDLTKQMITLATGLIALGITFNKDFVAKPADECVRNLLLGSWAVLAFSIAFGLWALMACAGIWGNHPADDTGPDPYARNLRWISSIQILLFGLGLILTIVSGFVSF